VATEITPASLPRRSPIWRHLADAGARFVALGDAAVAEDFGDADAEATRAARAGLADLSPLPRWGLKGAGTHDWLRGQAVPVPEANNRAVTPETGGLVARLSDSEALLLAGLEGSTEPIDVFRAAWNAARRAGARPGGYPVPRGDSHAWFRLTGAEAATALAKLCAVDLRPQAFESLAVAQTQMALVNAIVIRDDLGGTLAYHLLTDFASADYLWGALTDAIVEYGGGLVGWAALRRLAGA
jgi:sarcosine oxidase subunit gamma